MKILRGAGLALAFALGACAMFSQSGLQTILNGGQEAYLLYCAGNPSDITHCGQAAQIKATDAYKTASAAIDAYDFDKSAVNYAKAKKAVNDALKLLRDFS